ncbi:methyltransferase family protein [Nitrosomonas sp. Nm84]|uniref:class I SAM-dependent methyltransferase n=1 Tax=Nitrosomonas sp. Nm84 TaxID=200124 RepID=UPI000D765779|nr:class I SAM-dependent methyltransferase [Nitrosomonas sp. Nm84]PXW86741.1 methyltransferase family protein [Nitrosomonas sp. Nm84]
MNIIKSIFGIARHLPVLSHYVRYYDNLKISCADQTAKLAEYKYECGLFPPGHYHSPLPDFYLIERKAADIFLDPSPALIDIQLDMDGQLDLLRAFAELKESYDPPNDRDKSYRYWYNNDFFSYLDACVLAKMLLYFKPRRLIEVGSGYSSAVIQDINERHMDWSLRLTMIEPHPNRVNDLFRTDDFLRADLIQTPVESVVQTLWQELGENDILFIDSSHVSKIASDVNHIIFQVLPALKPGVIIHFHDIFYPFEYPKEWILGGVAWNESYILRAFLQNNDAYQIIFFNDYLKRFHREILHTALPISARDTEPDQAMINAPGNSIWIRKLR